MAFEDLPTLAELSRVRRPNAKPEPRVNAKDRAAKDDARKLETWKRDVRERDGMRCRVCKRRVEVILELRSNRAECHHIAPRADKHVRYDRRNGLLSCQTCHAKLESGEVRIIVTTAQFFTVETSAKPYINGDCPLEFSAVGEAHQ